MKYFVGALLIGSLVLVAAITVAGCGGGGGGIYCCTYESRHTACGGGDWTDWETEQYQFDIDDYLESWTPQMVCDKFTGSDDECGGGCCITVEYQNNVLVEGACPP